MAHKKPALLLTLAEEDVVIRERLMTRTQAAPPRLTYQKMLTQRFAALSASLLSDKGVGNCEKELAGLLEMLKTTVLPVEKTFWGVEASRRDAEVARMLHQSTLEEITKTQSEIERLKSDLDAARTERRNEEECEKVRETIAAEPSREQSLRAIAETEQEIAEMENTIAAAALAVEHRKKQFALLMHVIDSVQTEIQEERFLAIVQNQQVQQPEATALLPEAAALLPEAAADAMVLD